jgi:hypothetical protein
LAKRDNGLVRRIVGALVGAWAGALLTATVLGWVWYMSYLPEVADGRSQTGWIVAYVSAVTGSGIVGGLLGYAASGTARNRASA